jgi:hypothetical protein
MEYNTSRSRLVIPEYGRTVQKIAEYILTIEDKAERNRATLSLINIMGQVNPQPRDQAENKQKFWDHLFIFITGLGTSTMAKTWNVCLIML